jgi:large subunit ribosomal protein L15
MKLNSLKYSKGSRGHKVKHFGRGHGNNSSRGFKGNKGQGQRNTGNVRIGFEGGQTPIYYRTAKIGFNNYNFSNDYNVITINQLIQTGLTDFDKEILIKAKLIKKGNKLPTKLISSNVKLDKAINIVVDKATAGAVKAIEAAGGKVNLLDKD